MSKPGFWEKLLWSVALPGFAQLLSGEVVKGLILIFLEIWINVNAHLNQIIVASFHGDTLQAVEQTNFQWLMFYPCLYLFAIWDAIGQEERKKPFSYLPYVFSAYFGTIGVIYSPTITFFGVLPGPVFLPVLFLWLGAGIGAFLRKVLVF